MKQFLRGLSIGLMIGLAYIAITSFSQMLNSLDPDVPESTVVEGSVGSVPDSSDTAPDSPSSEGAAPGNAPDAADSGTSGAAETSDNALAEAPAASPVTISFAGDVQFSEQYLAAYDKNGIAAFADEEMLSLMRDSNLFLFNEEFPFSLQGEAMEDKQYTFRADPKYIAIFQDLGADIVTVANNHALDFGQDAFCDTLDTLQMADIACIGGGYNIEEASAPTIRKAEGQTFAFFGATRVSPSYDWYATKSQPGLFQTYDPAMLNEKIAAANEKYDHVIVFVHWGIERNDIPEEYQRTLAQGYIDAGADLIVGCHPHVLQGFEYYNGIPIVYSLGNYLFGNRTGETLLLQAVFSPEGTLDIQLVPCQRKNGVLSRITEPAALYEYLNSISFNAKVSGDGLLTQ